MIYALVKSALETGCLSVASESLIRQILAIRSFQSSEMEAIAKLEAALKRGEVQREACPSTLLNSFAVFHKSV
ncbi:hypothetical protein [Spirulina subsalsa]|uniref:hypothetical protein n=1 Tax=Spirulina subsalsa TaxID=54311 RepID=UPI000370C5DB|nr:hypothetical protein [Spirulina subsalsa]